MDIQQEIDEHVTLDNSFVKSIQIIGGSGSVIVPRGYNIRFINCNIGEITARDSALHFLGGTVEDLRLAECIVSMDGVTITKDLKTTNCRINLKKVPGALQSDDAGGSSMTVNGSIHMENTESFWHEVEWSGSEDSLIDNSRIEFYDCKIKLSAELKIHGSEVYFILGECTFTKKVEVKDLEPKSGDPEADMTSGGSPSKNKLRGTAGVGAGSIVNFKKVSKVEFTGEGTLDTTKSEVNFFDVSKVESDSKPIATYTTSNGKVSGSKLESKGDSCLVLKSSGHLHVTNSELKAKKPTIVVGGAKSNCTIYKGKFESTGDDCFSFSDRCFVEIYGVPKIKAVGNCVTANSATVFLSNCEKLEADGNTFDISNKSVLEAFYCGTLIGGIIFKGSDSSFLVRASNMTLDPKTKTISGTGVFVIMDPPAGRKGCCGG